MDLKDIIDVQMTPARHGRPAMVAITLNDPTTGRPGLTRHLDQRRALLFAVKIIDAAMEVGN